MTLRAEVLAKIDSIVHLPATAVKVVQLARDSNVSFSELGKLIQYDPGLSSNILRLANSAVFASPRSISSIPDALVRLGVEQVVELVLASAVSRMAASQVEGYHLRSGQLWEHSISVAVGTQQLARALNIDIPEYAFTAALLHDIGKVALGTFVELDLAAIMDLVYSQHIPFQEAERETLGIDHAELGAILLAKWGLPAHIIEVTRWHHRPKQASEVLQLVSLVHVADTLMLTAGIGTGNDGLNYSPDEEVVSGLNLSTQISEKVACETVSELERIREILSESNGR